jgi:putative intracellular protease/amidase/YHS domain-containing protein
MMDRRDLLRNTAALGIAAAIPFSAVGKRSEGPESIKEPNGADGNKTLDALQPLQPPVRGKIPVAFLISDGAVIIDFCGPWEVFEHVTSPVTSQGAFSLYTVAETTKPVQASGGMKIVPGYTLATAPAPKVIVIPAQNDPSEAALEWIRKSTRSTDVTMSVCTGAFVLAKTGLLSGKDATTHHGAYWDFAAAFPDIRVKRGARFVEDGNLASSGGLSSGIDLSLRVVERYFGRDVAQATAFEMEYQGQGWKNSQSNGEYAYVRSTSEHPECAVCAMNVDPKVAPKSAYAGRTYFFCSTDHKKLFDSTPENIARWVI